MYSQHYSTEVRLRVERRIQVGSSTKEVVRKVAVGLYVRAVPVSTRKKTVRERKRAKREVTKAVGNGQALEIICEVTKGIEDNPSGRKDSLEVT